VLLLDGSGTLQRVRSSDRSHPAGESFVSVIVAGVEAVVVRRMRLVLGLAAG